MSYEEKLIKHYRQQKHREEVNSGHDTRCLEFHITTIKRDKYSFYISILPNY